MKKNIDLHPQGDEVVNNNVKNVDPNPQQALNFNRSFTKDAPYLASSASNVPVSHTEGGLVVSGKVSWTVITPMDSHLPDFVSASFEEFKLAPLFSGTTGSAGSGGTTISYSSVDLDCRNVMLNGSMASCDISGIDITKTTTVYDSHGDVESITTEHLRGSVCLELIATPGAYLHEAIVHFFAHINLF